jgi:hypothetical protein
MIKKFKKSLSPIKLVLFFFLAAVLMTPIVVWGGSLVTGYQLAPNTASSTIDTPVGCKLVSSKAGVSYFIPTKTVTEWNTFAANKPAPLGIYECNAPACTSWTYSAWSVCSAGVKTRFQTGQSPAGCIGDAPAANLTSGCACTSCDYGGGYCQPNGYRYYDPVYSYPPGCTGCNTYVEPCTYVSQCGSGAGCMLHKLWNATSAYMSSWCGSGAGDPMNPITTYGACAPTWAASQGCINWSSYGWQSSETWEVLSEYYCTGMGDPCLNVTCPSGQACSNGYCEEAQTPCTGCTYSATACANCSQYQYLTGYTPAGCNPAYGAPSCTPDGNVYCSYCTDISGCGSQQCMDIDFYDGSMTNYAPAATCQGPIAPYGHGYECDSNTGAYCSQNSSYSGIGHTPVADYMCNSSVCTCNP